MFPHSLTGKVYIYGHTLISQGNSWYYLYNARGDVVKYTNANGAVLQSYDYDAFGEEADPSTTDANPFRYAGQYFDDETGTYYLRARYYNPGNGRFSQEDTHWNTGNMLYGDDPLMLTQYIAKPDILAVMQSANLYVYCANNPIIYVDSNGEKLLLYPGEIHREVSIRIKKNNPGFSRERWVRIPSSNSLTGYKRGRVDLVDTKTGYIFEIKPSTWDKADAKAQLKEYETGHFCAKSLRDLDIEVYTGSGSEYDLSGNFDYGVYDVSYWYEGDGIISYRADINRTRLEIEAINMGVTVAALLIFILSHGTIPLPVLA